jgi:hypothetical protein
MGGESGGGSGGGLGGQFGGRRGDGLRGGQNAGPSGGAGAGNGGMTFAPQVAAVPATQTPSKVLTNAAEPITAQDRIARARKRNPTTSTSSNDGQLAVATLLGQ